MKERLTKREKNGLAYFPMCFKPPCNGEGCPCRSRTMLPTPVKRQVIANDTTGQVH